MKKLINKILGKKPIPIYNYREAKDLHDLILINIIRCSEYWQLDNCELMLSDFKNKFPKEYKLIGRLLGECQIRRIEIQCNCEPIKTNKYE